MKSALKFEPIIIIGAARSGTNLLRDLISSHPDFVTWDCDEINPIWRHGNIFYQSDEFLPEMASPKISNFIQGEFKKISQKWPHKTIVEKTCANSVRVGFVKNIFPDAKFIFIVRDGRDVIASSMLRWESRFDFSYTLKKLKYVPFLDFPFYLFKFGMNRVKQFISTEKALDQWGVSLKDLKGNSQLSLLEVCLLQWKVSVQKANDQLLKYCNPNQVYFCRYENIVKNPKVELDLIFEYLGVDCSPLILNDLKVSKSSIGKHKSLLTVDQIGSISSIVEETLLNLSFN